MTLAAGRGPAPGAGGPIARSVLVALVAGAGLIAYLGMRPAQHWLLLFVALLVGLAASGTVRTHPRWSGGGEAGAAVFVFLPAISALAAGAFVDRAFEGYTRPVMAAVGSVLVSIVVLAEYYSVDAQSRLYGSVRLILAIATYLAAFALFAVLHSRQLPLPLSASAVALVAWALAVDLIRERRAVGVSSLLAGLAIAISLAELRIALYFFPLDGLLAGALLIIGFYLATGVVHHLLDNDLTVTTLSEYVLVAGVGTAVVVLGRTFS